MFISADEEKQKIRGAVSHWEENTCLRFKELATDESYSDNHISLLRATQGMCNTVIVLCPATP